MAVQNINKVNLSNYDKDFAFVLDTNILYFVHSGYYSTSDFKPKRYSNLISSILSNGNKIIISVLSLQELFFGIENKEYLLYCNNNGLSKDTYTKKDFRKDNSQRSRVEGKLKTVLKEVEQVYLIENSNVTKDMLIKFVDDFEKHKFDPIDYILKCNFNFNKNTAIITDDTDFICDNSINVITI